MLSKLWNIFRLRSDYVLFFDIFSRNNNGDSIRPIAELLRKRAPHLKFIFVTKSKKTKVDIADFTVVEKSIKFKILTRLAKYVVSPMGFPNKGKKRQGQVLIQTWHGTPIKKIYLSRDPNNKSYQRYAKQFAGTDIFCVSCDFAKDTFKKSFNLHDSQFINSGLPRNDILSGKNNSDLLKAKIKKELSIPENKKVLFYCPTWRRSDRKAVLPFDLEKLRESLQDEYVILIRSHVGLHKWVDKAGNIANIFDGKFSFDGGTYPEATELYLISDVLISDYSSSIFDFAITKKPQILYAYDLESYTKEFGLLIDYKDFSSYFPVAKNTDELIDAVKNLGDFYSKFGKGYETFRQKYCSYENGDATEQVANYILNKE